MKHDLGIARELDLPITVHVGRGRVAGRFNMVSQLNEMNLLGPDTTYIHSCYLSEEEWKLVADTGGKISISAQVELQMGHGYPPSLRARDLGLRPSLSIDVVTTVPGDMFTEMRAVFGSERVAVNAEYWKADVVVLDGKSPNVTPIIDPVATAVLFADVSNVDTVIINGEIHKRDGKLLVDFDRQRRLLEESRDYLIRSVPRDPNWMVPPAD